MTTKKCPKCQSPDFAIEETCTTTYVYEVKGGRVEAQGEYNDDQDHVRTLCICDRCGHRWHPRNMNYTVDF